MKKKWYWIAGALVAMALILSFASCGETGEKEKNGPVTPPDPDKAIVDAAINAVTAELGDLTAVTGDLFLPAEKNGVTITWESGNDNYLDNDGTVTRPEVGGQNVKVTLTATFTKGKVTKSKNFSVTITAPASQDEADVDAAITLVKHELGATNANAITGVTGDLTLPADKNGVAITWESGDTDHLEDDGAVTGSYDEDLTVTLTGTFEKGDVSKKVNFTVTIGRDGSKDEELVNAAIAEAQAYFDALGKVEESITLPVPSDNYINVIWTSDKPEYLNDNGAVTRSYDEDVEVTLTGIFMRFEEEESAHFTVTILRDDSRDQEHVDAAVAAMQAHLEGLDVIHEHLILPVVWEHGVSIEWSSDKPEYLAGDGTVTRPAEGQDNAAVVLTCTVTKGDAEETVDFHLTIRAHVPSWTVNFIDGPESYSGSTLTPRWIKYVDQSGNGMLEDDMPDDPNLAGYDFEGWWTQPRTGGTRVTADTAISANTTVYSRWALKDEVHELIFEVNGNDEFVGTFYDIAKAPLGTVTAELFGSANIVGNIGYPLRKAVALGGTGGYVNLGREAAMMVNNTKWTLEVYTNIPASAPANDHLVSVVQNNSDQTKGAMYMEMNDTRFRLRTGWSPSAGQTEIQGNPGGGRAGVWVALTYLKYPGDGGWISAMRDCGTLIESAASTVGAPLRVNDNCNPMNFFFLGRNPAGAITAADVQYHKIILRNEFYEGADYRVEYQDAVRATVEQLNRGTPEQELERKIKKAEVALGDLSTVDANVTLPASDELISVTWVSSNPAVFSDSGEVTRPSGSPATLTLTATFAIVDDPGMFETKTWNVRVMQEGAAPEDYLVLHLGYEDDGGAKVFKNLAWSGDFYEPSLVGGAAIETNGTYDVVSLGSAGYIDLGPKVGALLRKPEWTIEFYIWLTADNYTMFSFSNDENIDNGNASPWRGVVTFTNPALTVSLITNGRSGFTDTDTGTTNNAILNIGRSGGIAGRVNGWTHLMVCRYNNFIGIFRQGGMAQNDDNKSVARLNNDATYQFGAADDETFPLQYGYLGRSPFTGQTGRWGNMTGGKFYGVKVYTKSLVQLTGNTGNKPVWDAGINDRRTRKTAMNSQWGVTDTAN